jgi:hypothetical protein
MLCKDCNYFNFLSLVLLSGIQEPGIKTQQPGMANGCDHDPDLPQMGVIAWNLVSGV